MSLRLQTQMLKNSLNGSLCQVNSNGWRLIPFIAPVSFRYTGTPSRPSWVAIDLSFPKRNSRWSRVSRPISSSARVIRGCRTSEGVLGAHSPGIPRSHHDEHHHDAPPPVVEPGSGTSWLLPLTDMADGHQAFVRDKILTFRTITTLLEILHDPSLPINPPESIDRHSCTLNSQNPQILHGDQSGDNRSLTALATLLVRNQELAAVTMQHPSTPESTMDIIVCMHESSHQAMVSPEAFNCPSDARSAATNEQISPVHPGPLEIDPHNPMEYLKGVW